MGEEIVRKINQKLKILHQSANNIQPMKDDYEDADTETHTFDIAILVSIRNRKDILGQYSGIGEEYEFAGYPLYYTPELDKDKFKIVADLEPMIERRR